MFCATASLNASLLARSALQQQSLKVFGDLSISNSIDWKPAHAETDQQEGCRPSSPAGPPRISQKQAIRIEWDRVIGLRRVTQPAKDKPRAPLAVMKLPGHNKLN